MRVPVERKTIRFMPDSSRVVARFFNNGDQRTQNLVSRVLEMSDSHVNQILEQTLRDFSTRHRNISQIFIKHCSKIKNIIEEMQVNYSDLSQERILLIGSYCTMEFALESAAFFNPSIIEDYDQSYLEEGQKRVIMSFRATGEGHISSLVFRRGILDKNNNLQLMKIGSHIDKAEISHKKLYDKKRFIERLGEMDIPHTFSNAILNRLPDKFEYYALKQEVNRILENTNMIAERRIALEEMTWLVNSYYDIRFHHDSDLSARVIFPLSESESRGIEDARFVKFKDEEGKITIFATYTAYNGHTILPKLLSTTDFYNFRIMPLHGKGAQNKNLALFPSKIKGKYAMLSRIDGVNNYIMFSEKTTLWKNPILIQQPRYPWEFTQIGNCGSPLYTSEGWLIITHGVGPMRRYCIGASLFDLEDPVKEIGRLEEPLITPLEHEREGYVPNVVYSCGALIHNESLILPYAVSDYSSTYAVVNLTDLFSALKRN